MKKALTVTIACSFVMSGLIAQAQSKPGYKQLHQFSIKSDGGWDYITVDGAHNTIYVSHGSQVNILDETTGDSIGVIPNTAGVHGIALVPALNKGYTSNGRAGECTIFDLSSKKVLGQVKTGDNPDAIFYDDYSKHVITCNGRSSDATVIDPVTDKAIATIPLGGKPETAVSDGKGHIFMNIETTNEVVRVNAASFKVEARYKLTDTEGPTGLAIDRETNRLFVVGDKFMSVLDAGSGKMVAKLPIGDGCDGVAFDPVLKMAFSSNGEGTITVVKELSADRFEVAETVKSAPRARTIAIDSKTHHIFLPTADFSVPAAGTGRGQMAHGSFRVLEFGM